MYYILVLILTGQTPAMTSVDRVPSLQICESMGKQFKKESKFKNAGYMCLRRDIRYEN